MQAFPITRNFAILNNAMQTARGANNTAQNHGARVGHTSGTTDKKLVISQEDWEQRLARAKISRSDMNKLVMNYLSSEGYKEAAENFAEETGTKSPVDLATIDSRMQVRESIQKGDIPTAIGLINDLDPDILDYNPKIVFHLYQQQLIELIRNGETERALEFAQEELAPKGEANPEFLVDLERTMALLVIDPALLGSDLFDPYHRIRVANEVNAAILVSQGHEQGALLPNLLRLLVWSQEQLGGRVSFPKLTNLMECSFQMENGSNTTTTTTDTIEMQQ